MTEVQFIQVTPNMVESLAVTMRHEDVLEVKAVGQTPMSAVLDSLKASTIAYALYLDGLLACIWGVVRCSQTLLGPTDGGVAWMLTSDVVDKKPIAFAKLSKSVVRTLLLDFPALSNIVDARYEKALRWARWLGFEVSEPMPLGVNGEVFCRISIRRTAWAATHQLH